MANNDDPVSEETMTRLTYELENDPELLNFPAMDTMDEPREQHEKQGEDQDQDNNNMQVEEDDAEDKMETTEAAANQAPSLPAIKVSSFLLEVKKDTSSRNGLKDRITRVVIDNPRVRIYAQGETPSTAMTADGCNPAASKKKRTDTQEWKDRRLAYTVTGWVGRKDAAGSYPVLGYITKGKNDVFSKDKLNDPRRFVPISPTQLSAFHDPTVDWVKQANLTNAEVKQCDKLSSPKLGLENVSSLRVDPRFILHKVSQANKPKKPRTATTSASSQKQQQQQQSSKETKKKASSSTSTKKKATTSKKASALNPEDGVAVHQAIIVKAHEYLAALQSRPLEERAVHLATSPDYDALKAQIGSSSSSSSSFPSLRSENVDGLRCFPDDFEVDVQSLITGLLTPYENPNYVPPESWPTEPLMQAILVHGMWQQYARCPLARHLIANGAAMSEKNVDELYEQWRKNENQCLATRCLNAHERKYADDAASAVLKTNKPLAVAARALFAFSRAANKLGSITELTVPSDTTTFLRCALTNTVIGPGQSYYLLLARGRPTKQEPHGVEMAATVATTCLTEQCSLQRVFPSLVPLPSLSLSLSYLLVFFCVSKCPLLQTVPVEPMPEAAAAAPDEMILDAVDEKEEDEAEKAKEAARAKNRARAQARREKNREKAKAEKEALAEKEREAQREKEEKERKKQLKKDKKAEKKRLKKEEKKKKAAVPDVSSPKKQKREERSEADSSTLEKQKPAQKKVKTSEQHPQPQQKQPTLPSTSHPTKPKATSVAVATPFKPYYGTHSLLDAKNVVVDVNALFHALSGFGTSDTDVNKAIQASKKVLATIKDDLKNFPAWFGETNESKKERMAHMMMLVETTSAFVKHVSKLPQADQDAIAQHGQAPAISDDMASLLDGLDMPADEMAMCQQVMGGGNSDGKVKPMDKVAPPISVLVTMLQSSLQAGVVKEGRFYPLLRAQPLPLKVSSILAAFKPLCGNLDSEAAMHLGQYVACFQWLFPA